MSLLVLLRHGESLWNSQDRFTGWIDAPLTAHGRDSSAKVGQFLDRVNFNLAFTSRLQRARETLEIVLETLDQSRTPVVMDSALNERSYGDLQGLKKRDAAIKFGTDQVTLWRRNYFARPPNGESMEDCEKRTLPFFLWYVLDSVKAAENVLLVAHGNSLRPIVRFLEKLDATTAANMEIEFCRPYVYQYNKGHITRQEIISL